jgi:hypothetical protein
MNSSSHYIVKFELLGGLGNQLFQWAAANYYQQRSNNSITIDLTYCGPKFVEHNSVITDLKFDSKFDLRVVRGRNIRISHALESLSSKNRYINRLRNFFQGRYVAKSDGYIKDLLEVDSKIIRGYFQTHSYLSSLTEQPLQVSLRKPSLSTTNISDPFAVAIHIRRGDYLNLSSSFGVLADDYYLSALKLVREFLNPTSVCIFSNDTDAARGLANIIGPEAKVIENITGESDASTLIALSKFNYIITANSSFSWWAAILNEKKTVIYPKPWFRAIETSPDLHPKDWIPCESVWLD